MKNIFSLSILLFFLSSCSESKTNTENDNKQIDYLLNNLNTYAAKADYVNYFNCFSDSSCFMGTDATEKWTKQEFMLWAKPFFDKKRCWNFSSVKRTIYFTEDKKTAWFDELLKTQMKICRGSGVVAKENNVWKIKQYVLSMTIPNQYTNKIVDIKAGVEDSLLLQRRW